MAQLEITAMTFGPFGVGRLEGKTVMVANTAPGDLVEIEVVSQRRDYAIGRLEQVIQPGPARRRPPCPFLPRCGGCDWQQIKYSAQVRFKGELIVTEFRRGLGLEIDATNLVEAAPAEFGYRSRVRLKTGAGGQLGFYEQGSSSLVPIDNCIVAVPGLSLPHELVRLLGRRCAEVELVAGDRGQVIIAYLDGAPRAAEMACAQRIVESDPVTAGIVLRGPGVRHVVGDASITLILEPGCEVEAEADLFSQVNREQNLKLVAAVTEMAESDRGSRLLDLFCGAGNFSLPAARRGAAVTGVDTDELAVAAARRNAARHGFHSAQFLAMRADETARFLTQARYRPATVIIDPPRTGAANLMDVIARLQAKRVVYVSCNPATLVRDLRTLFAHGYKMARVKAFDFFPNTHHVEVAVLALLT
jgi:23S rRNA (uracil1939-C5)-methyltransferase